MCLIPRPVSRWWRRVATSSRVDKRERTGPRRRGRAISLAKTFSQRKPPANLDLGAHYLDLFERLYQNRSAARDIEGRIKEVQNRLSGRQAGCDNIKCELLRLRNDTRSDFTDLLEGGVQWKEESEEYLAQREELLENLEDELQANGQAFGEIWKEVYVYAHDYFNACLDANFGLGFPHVRECYRVRAVLDREILIDDGKDEARRLKRELTRTDGDLILLETQHRAERQDTPETISGRLTEDRIAALKRDSVDLRRRLTKFEKRLMRQQQFQRELHHEIVASTIKDLLEAAGRLEPQQSDDGQQRDVGDTIDTILDDRQASSTGNQITDPDDQSPMGTREGSGGDTQEYDLQTRYVDAYRQLEEMQDTVSKARTVANSTEEEWEFLMTFSNATLAQYRDIIEALIEDDFGAELREAEANLQAIQEEMAEAGVELPPSISPVPSQQGAIQGGGVSEAAQENGEAKISGDKKEMSARQRWRINRYRFGVSPLRPGSSFRDPTPPGDVDLSAVRDLDFYSPPAARRPSLERRRKEWQKAQQRERDEGAAETFVVPTSRTLGPRTTSKPR